MTRFGGLQAAERDFAVYGPGNGDFLSLCL